MNTLATPVDRNAAAQSAATAGAVAGVVAGIAETATGVRGLGRLVSTAFGGPALTGEESTAELLQIQREMQRETFFYSSSSAIQSAEHEARMAVVRNFKS